MGRAVRDSRLETRTARSKLRARKEPYWRGVSAGCHIGYYRGLRGGTWVARYRADSGRGYTKTSLGLADDVQDADGQRILSFAQAQEKARRWFHEMARAQDGSGHVGPYTVEDACRDYVEWFTSRRKSLHSTQLAINAHILPPLGSLRVAKLTTGIIRRWHDNVAAKPARLRTKRGAEQKFREPSQDPEVMRRRQATANRVLTVLKAVLNFAWREGRAASDEAWRKVKAFRGVDEARIRYLSDAECVRLVNACDPSFRPMVQAALLSGCRYGELASLQVSDYNAEAGTLWIRQAKGGRGRHVILTDEGQRFFATVSAGKPSDALMFTRPNGDAWGKSHQQRPLVEACEQAKIAPAVSFHLLRHTYASRLAMRGVALHVIAHNLGHADTRMTERHYAHLCPSYVADTIRNAAPALGIVPQTNTVSMPAKAA